jgi:hypothetical protein
MILPVPAVIQCEPLLDRFFWIVYRVVIGAAARDPYQLVGQIIAAASSLLLRRNFTS